MKTEVRIGNSAAAWFGVPASAGLAHDDPAARTFVTSDRLKPGLRTAVRIYSAGLKQS